MDNWPGRLSSDRLLLRQGASSTIGIRSVGGELDSRLLQGALWWAPSALAPVRLCSSDALWTETTLVLVVVVDVCWTWGWPVCWASLLGVLGPLWWPTRWNLACFPVTETLARQTGCLFHRRPTRWLVSKRPACLASARLSLCPLFIIKKESSPNRNQITTSFPWTDSSCAHLGTPSSQGVWLLIQDYMPAHFHPCLYEGIKKKKKKTRRRPARQRARESWLQIYIHQPVSFYCDLLSLGKGFLIGKMASWKGSQHTFRHAPVATERRNGPYLRLMTGGHRVERDRSWVIFFLSKWLTLLGGEIVSRVAEHKPAQKLQTNGKKGGGG